MDVVRLNDEGVEFVVAFAAVVLEGVDHEQGVGFDLEEAAAIVGRCGDEKGAGSGGARRDRHDEWQQRIAMRIGVRRDFLRFCE
jgi:hypothetical protein